MCNMICVHNARRCGIIVWGDDMAYNDKNKAYVAKYKADKIKRVPLDMQRTLYDAIQAHAQARGESVNGFIKRAIQETMERDDHNREHQTAGE